MSRRDGAWVKQQRIQQLARMIKGLGQIRLADFVPKAELVLGLSSRTIENYLQILVKSGFIWIEGGTIYEEKPEEGGAEP